MIDFPPSHPHDPRTMEDFYRPSLIGRGGPITPTSVSGTDFTLKNHMVRLIRQDCQFHGFRDEDANEHLNKFISITQSMKQRGVSQDSIRLNLFSFSLSHHAESWFYTLKTHSIHTWEEMFIKFLSKYFPRSKMVQRRKDILNFRQLPMESVFEAWERFKSLLQKCPDHQILLLDQILTFYHGITSFDRDKIMLAAGGNLMRKTPQEAYDLIENMTHHHCQWDAEVQYDSTTKLSVHHSDYTSAKIAQIEVLGKQESYICQFSQQGPVHPNTIYFSYSDEDESDEDEPAEIPQIQKSQGEKNMTESLAVEQMELVESIHASPSQLPESTVITPEIHTHSFIMGDEHLYTIPAKESDVFIKSSVENLVPIPRESQGILDHACDIPLPFVFPSDHVEMFSDSIDDDSLSCGDISYLEELSSELVSLEEENDEVTNIEIKDEALRATLLNVSLLISKIEAFKENSISSPIPIKDSDILSDDSIPDMEAFCFDIGEVISGNTTSHSHNSLPYYESFTFDEFPLELVNINSEYDSFTFEEFSLELTHIISPSEYDNFYFDLDTSGICLDQLSLNDEIHDIKIMNSPSDDDELVKIVIMIFFLFVTYPVTSPLLRSFGNEDTIFDPGILIYHF